MDVSEKYSENDNLTARFAKALGHPARIQILKLLSQQDNCFCGNIVDYIPLAQSTVSQHLKELKDVGLVRGRYEPPKVYYCIDEKNWNLTKSLLNDLLNVNIKSVCNIETKNE